MRITTDNPAVKERLVQSAPKEKMLCPKCDNERLAGWERYAQQAIDTIDALTPPLQPPHDEVVVEKLQYEPLKLFYVSLLWRMSVSRDPFFNSVNLGCYEDVARKMLLYGQPGSAEEFGVIRIDSLLDREMRAPSTTEPFRWRNAKSGTMYTILIEGMYYMFFVSPNFATPAIRPNLLQPDGTWRILRAPAENVPHMRDFLREMGIASLQRELMARTSAS